MYALTLQFPVFAVGCAFSHLFKVYTICVCAYLLFPTPYLPYIYGLVFYFTIFRGTDAVPTETTTILCCADAILFDKTLPLGRKKFLFIFTSGSLVKDLNHFSV